MKELYAQREKRYFALLMKYLRYVLNDHFVLVSLFLLGGLGYYYAQFVKGLPRDFFWGKVALVGIYLALLFVGRSVLLFVEADKVFLLVQELKIGVYLKQAKRRSLYFPLGLALLISLFLVPFVVRVCASIWTSVALGVIFVLFKERFLTISFADYFQNGRGYAKRMRLLLLMFFLLSLSLELWDLPFSGVAIAVVFFIGTCLKKPDLHFFDWEKVVAYERNRKTLLLKFFSLFADVPGLPSKVKRRKMFDSLIFFLERGNQNPYYALFLRAFFRGGEYGSLYLRLLILSLGIFWFVPNMYILLPVGCLFLYLIGFQLLPLTLQFEYMVLTQLYPLAPKLKVSGIQRVLRIVMTSLSVLYAAEAFCLLRDVGQVALCFVAYVVFSVLFVKIYLPQRIKKLF